MKYGLYTRTMGAEFVTIFSDNSGWNWDALSNRQKTVDGTDDLGRWVYRQKGQWAFNEERHGSYLDKYFAPIILVDWK